MESILSLVINAENGRMLVLLAFGCCFFVWLKTSFEKNIDELKVTLNGRIDELRAELRGDMKELKYNDFAHLSSAFEALTYVLEKNSSLSKEDKEFVDSRLAH